MAYKSGEDFLNKIYPNLINLKVVNNHTLKSDSPEETIRKYLLRLEKMHYKYYGDLSTLLRKFYYQKYIIKSVPESYLKQQQKIARMEGYGYLNFNEETISELLKELQNNQELSLDKWIIYFTSNDCPYPTWFKVYAFEGMSKLGKYDKEKGEFRKRTGTTVEPFLELNREILAYIYDLLNKNINNKKLTLDEVEILNKGESFKKLYTYYFKKMYEKNRLLSIDGKWIKYYQGNNYEPLWKSLQGKNTGWCTAGEETAKFQVANGDFYVYYTKDEEGLYTNPRVAIRMNGADEIGEIRGIGENQEIEPEMLDIVSEKLNEFSDKDNYLKKVHDMKLLTTIEEKINQNIELSRDELIFLYELHGKVKSFGYYDGDPRTTELILNRDYKADMVKIFNVDKKSVATKISDFKNNNIIVYYKPIGSLDSMQDVIEKYGYKALASLKYTVNASFYALESSKGFNNVEIIYGNFECVYIDDVTGFTNLKVVYGNVGLDDLDDVTGLENLKFIYGNCSLNNIESSKGLENLEYIQGRLGCRDLIDSSGLKSLTEIGNGCYLWHLKHSSGLKKLKRIGGNAEFNTLKTLDDFPSLEVVEGNLWVPNLENKNDIHKIKILKKN